jgi:glutamine synthetase
MAKKTPNANASRGVLEALRKSGATKVKVAVSDIDGVLRGKYLHKDKFERGRTLPEPAASASATWCWAGT